MDSKYDPDEGARQAVQGRTVAEVMPIFGAELPVSGDRLAEWRAFSNVPQDGSLWAHAAACHDWS